MGKPPTFFDLSRGRRHAFLTFMLCTLGIIWFFALMEKDDRKELLKPATNIFNKVSFRKGPHNPIADLSHLEKHQLSPQFSYSRRMIKTKHYHGARPELINLNTTTLFDTPQMLSFDELQDVEITAELPPLTLEVPYSPKVDSSIMSFGIATSADRVPDSIPQLQHWLPNTESSLHIVVPPDYKTTKLQQQMRDLHIKTAFRSTQLDFAHTYFSLIKTLYDARTPKTQWLVLIDDDTFVPSLPALIAHLNKAYDASEEVLLAAMSDNIDQIRKFGLLPFGGGGIFVSVPLAAKMTSPEVWEKCMEIPDNQGDQIVSECLNMHTRVRPTFDQGLNQMDFRGDDNVAAGYFESGRQMLTVHHWRSWYNVDMPTVGLVGKACGNEGLLMRWVFDNNFVLSNGYSIVEYPNGADKINFEHVEMTMEAGSIPKYIHKIGPLREKLPDEDKKTFKMLDAEIVEGWGVRQTYIEKAPREKIKDEKEGEGKKEEDEKKKEEVIIHGDDRVVELVWLF